MAAECVSERNLDIIVLLADGLFHEILPEVLRPDLPKNFPENSLRKLCSEESRPSNNPRFREALRATFRKNVASPSVELLSKLMSAMDSRLYVFALTGGWKLVQDMSIKEREALLLHWKTSYMSIKQRALKAIFALSTSTIVRLSMDEYYISIGHPKKEIRSEVLKQGIQNAPKPYLFESHPKEENNNISSHVRDHDDPDPVYDHRIDYSGVIDVVIIGSGCGAGAVADTLAEQGFKSLILEKGSYIDASATPLDEDEGMWRRYECGGTMVSKSTEILALAGATFGGGSALNWSACLDTEWNVREEWKTEYGIDWITDPEYDGHMAYVAEKIGATTADINHSLGNKCILEGSAKLGFPCHEIRQNKKLGDSCHVKGQVSHDCGLCYLGCPMNVKQGTPQAWFETPRQSGSKFMQNVRVVEIVRDADTNKPIAINCESSETGKKFAITGFRKVVVSAGSFNTPIILRKSGFRNRNIGINLKMHPVTTIYGYMGPDADLKPWAHPILTSVCEEVADRDGAGYGARIETVLSSPVINAAMLPWEDSETYRRDLGRYNKMVTLLLIARDRGSGAVYADPMMPGKLIVDYEIDRFDAQSLLEAQLIAADLLYVSGVHEIIPSQSGSPRFNTKDSPKPEERCVNDPEYAQWREQISKIALVRYKTMFGSAHQMSSCRMSGNGPEQGAVDSSGRLYECPDIYVADASVFPTGSGTNPMITVLSVARHIGFRLAETLKNEK